MLRSNSEDSNSDSASFYSIDTEISEKLPTKLNKFGSFKSIYSIDSKSDSSPHFESLDSVEKGYGDNLVSEKSYRLQNEISELDQTLNIPKNAVNVIIMSSSSGATSKNDLPNSDIKEPGKKKKGIRLSFKRKKSSKKVEKKKGGFAGTDSDLSSSNPITPQITPHGTLEKNATPWKNLDEESLETIAVGKENQVSGKVQSEKRFGSILTLRREPRKSKENIPTVELPHASTTAHEFVQTPSDDENYKIVTPNPLASKVVESESVTDRAAVHVPQKYTFPLKAAATVEELWSFDDPPLKSSIISNSTLEEEEECLDKNIYTSTFHTLRNEKLISVKNEVEKGEDIAEGRVNPEKFEQVEEKFVPNRDVDSTKNLLELADETAVDEADDTEIEALVNEVKSIAQEIVEVELNEKTNLPKPFTSIEELSTEKVNVRRKISLEAISSESRNISRPIYLSLTEPIPYLNQNINYSPVNPKLNSSYPSFSSKIVISIEEPASKDSPYSKGDMVEDSTAKNIANQFGKYPKPLSLKHYAPFGKACRPSFTSMSLSRSFSNDTEDEGFFIPRKSPFSYSNNYLSSRGNNYTMCSKVESSGQLSDSWAVSSSDKKEHLYKILVIGELGTGKTSIIKRYVHQFFCQHYRATIGVDFALKVLNWDENTVIRLQLWDIAGQERFGNMTRVYYKQAVGAFVVFDVSNTKTFDAVTKWKNDLDSKVTLPDGSSIPTVLLANKCDQPKEGLVASPTKMDDYCRERNFAGWFETSAKEDVNIDEATKFLISKIFNNEEEGLMVDESFDKDKFSIDGNNEEVERKKCIC